MKRVIPPQVKVILNTLQDAGHSAELVGGCVRDFLLKRVPRDYDICTSALPPAVNRAMMNSGIPCYPTGIEHGTVTAVFDSAPVEITTYRSESGYSDGRRPDSVEFGVSAAEDVTRRDFTVNGLLFNGDAIIDHVGGLADLSAKVIRCIGVPADRFDEDALRMLRAVRLACQLGFTICPETLAAIRKRASRLTGWVSAERIMVELSKILMSTNPRRGIELLRETGLLAHVLPEIHTLIGVDQCNPRHNSDVYEHTLRALEATPPILHLRLAALFHDVGKPATKTVGEDGIGHFYSHHKVGADMTRDILSRMRFSGEIVEKAAHLVYEHMSRNPYFRQGGLKRLIRRVGAYNLDDLFHLMIADVISHAPPFSADLEEVMQLQREVWATVEAGEPMSVKDLALSGYDLMGVGVKPGPEMGRILGELLELVLEQPDKNNREDLTFMVALLTMPIMERKPGPKCNHPGCHVPVVDRCEECGKAA